MFCSIGERFDLVTGHSVRPQLPWKLIKNGGYNEELRSWLGTWLTQSLVADDGLPLVTLLVAFNKFDTQSRLVVVKGFNPQNRRISYTG